MEKPMIQVGTLVLTVAHIVRISQVPEQRYESGHVMTPARMLVAMTNNDTHTILEASVEGKALRAWWESRVTVLAPMPESEAAQ
jgi:hypothetical protein